MRKVLYLLRHAKAAPAAAGQADHARPLSGKGREGCRLVAAYLAELDMLPRTVICSTSARTRETLDRIAEALGWSPQVAFSDRAYLATAGTLLTLARQIPEEAPSAILVGHNPGMEELAIELAGAGPAKLRQAMSTKFPTGALATLAFEGPWLAIGPRTGTLTDFVTPALLADRALVFTPKQAVK
jgi:phosphohistidine phosphatase